MAVLNALKNAVITPLEQVYLSGTRDFTKAQQRYTSYRLKKKFRILAETRDAAAAQLICQDRLETLLVGMAEPGKALPYNNNLKSLGREYRHFLALSDPRPLPQWGIAAADDGEERYLTKVTLYQALGVLRWYFESTCIMVRLAL